jgi:hypothetical protein
MGWAIRWSCDAKRGLSFFERDAAATAHQAHWTSAMLTPSVMSTV